MKNTLRILAAAVLVTACCGAPEDGEHTLRILTTNDIHGSYFDDQYVGGRQRNSLMAVKHYVDSVRSAAGADNVILIDAGDFLQGDNAAYYYNYVDTVGPHVYCRMADWLDYDAVCVGNHDIEPGHAVYDRIDRELADAGIPFLAGNAISSKDGKPYFTPYKIFKRAGLKVAVLGYTNPNMAAWLDESVWSGITFESLIPKVQEDVDRIIASEHPQVVIAAVHSGTGKGDGSILESQGKDLFQSLKGVDFVICSHDHRPLTLEGDGICLINSGSHCRNVGYGEITVTVKDRKVESKALKAGLIPVDAAMADKQMKEAFKADFEAVKAFTLKEVGELRSDLVTAESYLGMCDYMNLIHTVCLQATGAQICFAAPLTFNGRVKAGTLIYNDLFTIYPYENQLFTVSLTGKEIKDYLEFSYDQWIQTMTPGPGSHVLKIFPVADPRTGQKKWSFQERAYNFDSASGLKYTVDVTRDFGERVSIISMADGTPFDESGTYSVAMTSYRASGGGGLLFEGAGIKAEDSDTRVTAKYPEIRNLIYEYIVKNGAIDPAATGDESLIGNWAFIPESAQPVLRKDYALLFE